MEESNLRWRNTFAFALFPFYFSFSGCGVMQAFESWELVTTVRFCPPRPITSECHLLGLLCESHGIQRSYAQETVWFVG